MIAREYNFYVYIMASCSGTLYVGITNDLERRVYEHKHNLIEGFTPLEAECPAVYRRDECLYFLANTGFNAPCELLTGFTKKYSCHKLVYYEHFTNVYEAINREKQIKRWRREKKQNLIRTINRSWRDLSREWG